MNRPIGIYEWCALTQEMLRRVYPEHAFPREGNYGWMQEIRDALATVKQRWPESIERGEKLLKDKELIDE